MRSRVMGIETEYGLQTRRASGSTVPPEEVGNQLLSGLRTTGPLSTNSHFLSNGARAYLDVGAHPEWATPECLSWRDVLAADLAGERVFATEALRVEASLTARDGESVRVHLLKGNLDSAGSTFGCHENFLVPRSVPMDLLVPVVASFMATRPVLTGAGAVVRLPDGRCRFELSARAAHMTTVSSNSTTRDRPLVNLRDEPHADFDVYRRLHLVSGDTNLCHAATALKMGVTSLVLRLLEETRSTWRTVVLESPVRMMRKVSLDVDLVERLTLESGRTITALDHQEHLLTRVSRLLEREGGSGEDFEALALWEETLADLRSGGESVLDRVDWARKRFLLDSFRTRHGLSWGDRVLTDLDMSYGDVVAGRGLHYLLDQKVPQRPLVSEEAVASACLFPPSRTRAVLRARFVAEVVKLGRRPVVDWTSLRVEGESGQPILIRDPFASEDQRVDDFLAVLTPPPTP